MRCTLWGTLAAVTLTVAAPAASQRPSFSDSPLMRQGFQQYDDLDLDAALASFQKAAVDTTASTASRAAAYAFAGMTAMALGKQTNARGLFEKAVELDPKVSLPADEAPPKVVALLEEVRKQQQGIKVSAPARREEFTEAPPEHKESGGSRLPLILGIGGGAVAVAAVAVVLIFVLKGSSCATPQGTGCIDIKTGAPP
jgi:hypothetical protein